MVKENKVSLWLGFYENADDFKNYIKVSYDEDGNYIPSNFQESYAIKRYDLDAIESDWISERCSDVESLLVGVDVIDRRKEEIGKTLLDEIIIDLTNHKVAICKDFFEKLRKNYISIDNKISMRCKYEKFLEYYESLSTYLND